MNTRRTTLTALAIALLAVIVVSLAQNLPAPEPVPSDGVRWGSLLGEFLGGLTPVLLDLLITLAAVAFGFLGNWLRKLTSKVDNDIFRNALQTLDELARTKVLEIYQDAIDDLKNAAEDGRLTIEEARAAAEVALEELTSALPSWLLRTLQAAVNGTLADVQERFLLPAIEKAVQDTKLLTEGKASIATDADPQRLQERVSAARARLGLTID